LRFAPGLPLTLPAGDDDEGGGVCPAERGGGSPARPGNPWRGAGEDLDGGAESDNDDGVSPEVVERDELGREGGAKPPEAPAKADAALGGGVIPSATGPACMGDAVCALDGGGRGVLGVVSSVPAYRKSAIWIVRIFFLSTHPFIDPLPQFLIKIESVFVS
jgi:hypothetical protein